MLGFALPQFGESAHDDLVRFASTAEQLGADSLWVGDRLLAATVTTTARLGAAFSSHPGIRRSSWPGS